MEQAFVICQGGVGGMDEGAGGWKAVATIPGHWGLVGEQYGPAAECGVVELLHGSIEGVQVGGDDVAWRGHRAQTGTG